MRNNADNPNVYAAFKDFREMYDIAFDALGCESRSCEKWTTAKTIMLKAKREMDEARADMKVRYAAISGNPAMLTNVGE